MLGSLEGGKRNPNEGHTFEASRVRAHDACFLFSLFQHFCENSEAFTKVRPAIQFLQFLLIGLDCKGGCFPMCAKSASTPTAPSPVLFLLTDILCLGIHQTLLRCQSPGRGAGCRIGETQISLWRNAAQFLNQTWKCLVQTRTPGETLLRKLVPPRNLVFIVRLTYRSAFTSFANLLATNFGKVGL